MAGIGMISAGMVNHKNKWRKRKKTYFVSYKHIIDVEVLFYLNYTAYIG